MARGDVGLPRTAALPRRETCVASARISPATLAHSKALHYGGTGSGLRFVELQRPDGSTTRAPLTLSFQQLLISLHAPPGTFPKNMTFFLLSPLLQKAFLQVVAKARARVQTRFEF